MNIKFNELTSNMAQSVTCRAAVKKLGVGLAGMAIAFLFKGWVQRNRNDQTFNKAFRQIRIL